MSPRRWLREPLILFLLGGLAIFAFFAWVGTPADPASRSIHLTRQDQARLSANFAQIMGRPPTQQELDSLIRQWVREEVLYREALRLGLDQGDAVIRKRLGQKMDVIAASAADAEQPGEAVLEKWRTSHAERFAVDSRMTFDQLFFTDEGKARAAQILLRDGADWRKLGDPISLPAHFTQATRTDIASEFGTDFGVAIDAMQPGSGWQGPVKTSLGWFLVRLTGREQGRVPPLGEIRQRVEDDWRADTERQRKDKAYALLRQAYSVTVDK